MKKVLTVHPFLFAGWMVLFVYAQNVQFVIYRQTWLPLAVLEALTVILFLPFLLILRNAMKAGLLVSLFVVLFFSYGHVFFLLWKDKGYLATQESQTLMIVWIVIFVVGSALALRLQKGWPEITQMLNVVAATLIALSLVRIVTWEVQARRAHADTSVQPVPAMEVTRAQADPLPDIYYLILDAYARADILDEVYGYDNSEFVTFLQERGFFVASESRSNYAQTELSLASSLNMTYLDDLAAAVGPEARDRRPFEYMIQHSAVVKFLSEQGYEIVAMPSGYYATDLRGADEHVATSRGWNELETRLLCSTPLPWITAHGVLFDPYAVHRQKILYNVDHITDTAQMPSPRFVFMHLMAPHAPFVLDAEGNAIDPARQFDLRTMGSSNKTGQVRPDYVRGYTGQLAFVNKRMMAVIDELVTTASRPTIIIVQGDHGPDGLIDWDNPANTYFKEKHAILNAYLLPGDGTKILYDGITPVNTFRLVFSHYLGLDLPLLEDRSYFSNWTRPYEFLDVTDDVIAGRRPSTPGQ